MPHAIDRYVRHLPPSSSPWKPFARFPTWMWRNEEVRLFAEWLRQKNATINDPERRAGFYGLDLYSLFASADAVIRYLVTVDPSAARVARERYGALTPWQHDPAAYGRAVVTGQFESCEEEVVEGPGRLTRSPARVLVPGRGALSRWSAERHGGGECRAVLPRDVPGQRRRRGTFGTSTCSTPSRRCWPFMARLPGPWCGRTTRISVMRGDRDGGAR